MLAVVYLRFLCEGMNGVWVFVPIFMRGGWPIHKVGEAAWRMGPLSCGNNFRRPLLVSTPVGQRCSFNLALERDVDSKMGHPNLNSVHRHPRFALALIVVLLITSLLLLAPRSTPDRFEGALNYLWRRTFTAHPRRATLTSWTSVQQRARPSTWTRDTTQACPCGVTFKRRWSTAKASTRTLSVNETTSFVSGAARASRREPLSLSRLQSFDAFS